MFGYADVGYVLELNKSQFQTKYAFIYGSAIISYRSSGEIRLVTSSNHSKIFLIHKTNCKHV